MTSCQSFRLLTNASQVRHLLNLQVRGKWHESDILREESRILRFAKHS